MDNQFIQRAYRLSILLLFFLARSAPGRYHTHKPGFLIAVVVASRAVRNPRLEVRDEGKTGMIRATNSLSAEVLVEGATLGAAGLVPFRDSYLPCLRGNKVGPAKAELLGVPFPRFVSRAGRRDAVGP